MVLCAHEWPTVPRNELELGRSHSPCQKVGNHPNMNHVFGHNQNKCKASFFHKPNTPLNFAVIFNCVCLFISPCMLVCISSDDQHRFAGLCSDVLHLPYLTRQCNIFYLYPRNVSHILAVQFFWQYYVNWWAQFEIVVSASIALLLGHVISRSILVAFCDSTHVQTCAQTVDYCMLLSL
jgi:hypothetical protein